MKKILILVMSCDQELFIKEEQCIKETWAKDIIDGKYENIDFLIYSSKKDIEKVRYEKSNHIIYFPNNVMINHTYDWDGHNYKKSYDEHTYRKTYDMFNICNKLFDYDYIFRTNTSTYVNVDLLNKFVQTLEDDNIVWTSELYSLEYALTPKPFMLYGRGNGLLLSKKNINIILKEGLSLYNLDGADDWFIGSILNCHHIQNNENYLDYIKSFTHGWYKSTYEPTGNKGTNLNNHKLCDFCNDNDSFDFLKKFITIQIKSYMCREVEITHMQNIHQILHNKEYTNDIIEFIYNYAKTPSVFTDSMKYTDYEEFI